MRLNFSAFRSRATRLFIMAVAASIALPIPPGVRAGGEHSGGHGHAHGSAPEALIGEPGRRADVTRTVTVTMTDNRYAPDRLMVKKGETIRFIVRNEGTVVHEFNIGTAMMHKAHQKEMTRMMERGVMETDRVNYAKMNMNGGDETMKHHDPNSALLPPKKSGEVIWKFGNSGELEFACNVPGHYESGMVGKISIQ